MRVVSMGDLNSLTRDELQSVAANAANTPRIRAAALLLWRLFDQGETLRSFSDKDNETILLSENRRPRHFDQ